MTPDPKPLSKPRRVLWAFKAEASRTVEEHYDTTGQAIAVPILVGVLVSVFGYAIVGLWRPATIAETIAFISVFALELMFVWLLADALYATVIYATEATTEQAIHRVDSP